MSRLDAAEVMADNCTIEGKEDPVEASEADEIRTLDELRDKIAELRASRRRLVLAAGTERRALERELHDGLQQQLVGLAANLELATRSLDADPSAAGTLLAEMRRDLQEALEQTRALAHRIAPPLLDRGGLLVSLRAAAASANVPSQIDVAASAYPPELASAVYFCFVDVLGRVSEGTSLTLNVRDAEESLVFEMTADADVDTEALFLGDRVEALGGELTIRSHTGKGTTWAGTLPLSR